MASRDDMIKIAAVIAVSENYADFARKVNSVKIVPPLQAKQKKMIWERVEPLMKGLQKDPETIARLLGN